MPLDTAASILRCIYLSDLSERAVLARLSVAARTPFDERMARFLAQTLEEIIPEANAGFSEDSDSAETEALLEQLGRKIVRRKNG